MMNTPTHESHARRLTALLRNQAGICRVNARTVQPEIWPPGTKARGIANHQYATWVNASTRLMDIASEMEKEYFQS